MYIIYDLYISISTCILSLTYLALYPLPGDFDLRFSLDLESTFRLSFSADDVFEEGAG